MKLKEARGGREGWKRVGRSKGKGGKEGRKEKRGSGWMMGFVFIIFFFLGCFHGHRSPLLRRARFEAFPFSFFSPGVGVLVGFSYVWKKGRNRCIGTVGRGCLGEEGGGVWGVF